MSVSGSPICEHKKLRLSCALCKATGAPRAEAGLKTTPFVARDERDAPKRAPRVAPPATRAPREPAPLRATGPGKPLMPKRRGKNAVTAADEANAQAWWVDKGRK